MVCHLGYKAVPKQRTYRGRMAAMAALLVSAASVFGSAYAEEEATTAMNTSRTDSAASTIAEQITQPYAANYELLRRGRRHGTASRVLTQHENGVWHYETSSRASLLFLSDRRHNESTFALQGGRVQPITYVYERRGTGSNQDYAVRFDHAAGELLEMNGYAVTAQWHNDLLDANAVLHQLQIDLAIGELTEFDYFLIDEDGRDINYEFAIVGTEQMKVGDREREVVKVERVRDHDRRQTYFWFAPSLNYTLVSMQQVEGGKEQLQLQLRDLSFPRP